MLDESKQDQQAPEQKVNEQDQRGMESKKKTPGYKQPAYEHYQPQQGAKKWMPHDQKQPGTWYNQGNQQQGLYQPPQYEIIVWVKEDGDLLHRHSQTSSKAEYLCNMVSHPVP